MESCDTFVTKEDNVVLSDLLFYVTNKFNTHPHDTIIDICDKFYDDRTIAEEKTKFFISISKKCPARRNQDKKRKDLEDVLNELKTRDKAGTFVPVFAAINLHNLPVTEDGTVTSSQLLATWRDVRSDTTTQAEQNFLGKKIPNPT